MNNSIWFTDSLVHVHAETGSYALLEFLLPHGHMPPPHVHTDDDEGFFVLEGEMTLHGEDGPTVLRPGECRNIPAGTPHTCEVTSAGPARVMVVAAPGRFADFVRMVGTPAERQALPVVDGPPDLELMQRAADAHGIEFVESLDRAPA